MKTKSYNLTDEEADLIIRQLEELPHKTSDKLIINMRSQYQNQLHKQLIKEVEPVAKEIEYPKKTEIPLRKNEPEVMEKK